MPHSHRGKGWDRTLGAARAVGKESFSGANRVSRGVGEGHCPAAHRSSEEERPMSEQKMSNGRWWMDYRRTLYSFRSLGLFSAQ